MLAEQALAYIYFEDEPVQQRSTERLRSCAMVQPDVSSHSICLNFGFGKRASPDQCRPRAFKQEDDREA
jgi:hypothetical protein